MTDVWALKQERLFAKYRNSPNILGIMEILSDPAQDTRDVLDWLLGQLSLSTATGEVLDFFGELIGVTRPLAQEDDILWLCADWETADDPDNHYGLATDALTEGGYLTGDDGVLSKSSPGSYMGDDDYRELIASKGSTYRQKATRGIVYTYILELGIRCKIIESDKIVDLQPHSYDALNYWLRNYITSRGFRPAGIQIRIPDQTEPDPEV